MGGAPAEERYFVPCPCCPHGRREVTREEFYGATEEPTRYERHRAIAEGALDFPTEEDRAATFKLGIDK